MRAQERKIGRHKKNIFKHFQQQKNTKKVEKTISIRRKKPNFRTQYKQKMNSERVSEEIIIKYI